MLSQPFIRPLIPPLCPAAFLPVTFRESIPLGETDLTQAEIHALIQHMGNEYKGNKYHLLQRNWYADVLSFQCLPRGA